MRATAAITTSVTNGAFLLSTRTTASPPLVSNRSSVDIQTLSEWHQNSSCVQILWVASDNLFTFPKRCSVNKSSLITFPCYSSLSRLWGVDDSSFDRSTFWFSTFVHSFYFFRVVRYLISKLTCVLMYLTRGLTPEGTPALLTAPLK